MDAARVERTRLATAFEAYRNVLDFTARVRLRGESPDTLETLAITLLAAAYTLRRNDWRGISDPPFHEMRHIRTAMRMLNTATCGYNGHSCDLETDDWISGPRQHWSRKKGGTDNG